MRVLMHKGFPLISFFCPRRGATLSPRNDRARYIYDAAVLPADQGALFREVKDTSKGVVLKMHWIRTIESFYLGRAKKRSNRSRPKKRTSPPPLLASSRGTGSAVSKLQHRRPRASVTPEKLKTVTRETNLRAQSARRRVRRLCRVTHYHTRRTRTHSSSART